MNNNTAAYQELINQCTPAAQAWVSYNWNALHDACSDINNKMSLIAGYNWSDFDDLYISLYKNNHGSFSVRIDGGSNYNGKCVTYIFNVKDGNLYDFSGCLQKYKEDIYADISRMALDILTEMAQAA